MKNTLSLVRILYDPTRIDRQVKVVNCWLLFPLMRPLRLVIMEVIRGSFCEAGPGLNSLTSSAIPESKDWFKLKCIPKFFYILSSTTLRFLFYVLVLLYAGYVLFDFFLDGTNHTNWMISIKIQRHVFITTIIFFLLYLHLQIYVLVEVKNMDWNLVETFIRPVLIIGTWEYSVLLYKEFFYKKEYSQ